MAKYLPTVRSKTGLNLDYLSTDPERIKFLEKTPKRVETTGPQMGAMLQRGEKLVDAEFVSGFIDKPVVSFHGTGDYINAFRGTAQFTDLLEVSDKKLYSYPEYYHDLFHETRERVDNVLNDTFEWLDARTDNSAAPSTRKEATEQEEQVTALEKEQYESSADINPQTATVIA